MNHATEEFPAKIRITCPCGKRYAVPRSVCGRKVRCGRCRRRLLVGTQLKQQPALAAAGLVLAPAPARPALNQAPAPTRPVLDLAPAPALELAPVPTRPVLDLAPAPTRRSAPGRRSDTNPYTPPGSGSTRSGRRLTPEGFFRQRDLAAEGHVVAIGFWTSVWSGLSLLGMIVLSAFAGFELTALLFLPVLAIFGFSLFLGIRLMQQVNWARIVFSVFCGLEVVRSLHALLVLTWAGEMLLARGIVILWLFWLGAQLWALCGSRASRIFQPAYQAKRLEDGRTVAFWWSPFFLIPAAMVLFGLIAAVLAGARLLSMFA